MKITFCALMMLSILAAPLYGQGSINNTIGTGGSFTIQDASTTFLSLSQSNGYLGLNKSLTLPVTTGSTLGVIFKGADRFIHDYPGNASNTFVGINSGNFTMTGYSNSAFGKDALPANTSGYNNSAFGQFVLYSNTTGYNNSAFGGGALAGNTTGYSNSAFGRLALAGNNSTGHGNSAFGDEALEHNSTGYSNSAFGIVALYTNTTGHDNSAFGEGALRNNTTGYNNSAVGGNTLNNNSTGFYNSAFGSSALTASTTGYLNSAFGSFALSHNTTGFSNSAFGDSAGYNLTTGSNNTLLGSNAQPSSAGVDNEVTLGNASVTSLRCNTTTITSLSDIRDKKNIRDLPLGLEFLMSIKPRLYNWDRREWYEDGKPNGLKMQKTPTAGFVAQELDEAQTKADAEWLTLVLKSNPNRLEATPGNLLPIMVKAIQELKAENDALKYELEAIRTSIRQGVRDEVKKALSNTGETKLSANKTKN